MAQRVRPNKRQRRQGKLVFGVHKLTRACAKFCSRHVRSFLRCGLRCRADFTTTPKAPPSSLSRSLFAPNTKEAYKLHTQCIVQVF